MISKKDILEELNRYKNKYIIVEGKKDKFALEKLNFTKIYKLEKPLFEEVELISAETKEVVILTDLDTEGKKIYSYLKKHLQEHGVKINDNLRKFLSKTEIKQIEGLAHYLKDESMPNM
ncbi:toprim domain-containing protein [Candidatus Woesearchaeota archaeon]|nr:toprim domain-containing protein [Candidatus Woesearchaeota archaeon]